MKLRRLSSDSRAESRRAVLLLAPSRGLGGGIERYAETLESAFAEHNVDVHRIDLYGTDKASRASAHARMAISCRGYLAEREMPPYVVIMHRGLLPTAAPLIWHYPVAGVSLICHGNELWGPRPRVRGYIEGYLMRMPRLRIIATSSYTAGALSGICSARVLHPGLSREWFQVLVASTRSIEREPGVNITTAFRLAQWREKGLSQLLSAVASLRRPDARVVICGSGQPTADLLGVIRQYKFCTLRVGLTPPQLADQYASADLFVLATQPGLESHTYCESFGLVLMEAQIASTPVVAPAYGGSRDVFIPGRTGLAPANESVDALAEVLNELLGDPHRLSYMGDFAQTWAREVFEPGLYASRAVDMLL